MTTVYVYEKDGKVKVIDGGSPAKHRSLKLEGWKLTHTVDACVFIENLVNTGVLNTEMKHSL